MSKLDASVPVWEVKWMNSQNVANPDPKNFSGRTFRVQPSPDKPVCDKTTFDRLVDNGCRGLYQGVYRFKYNEGCIFLGGSSDMDFSDYLSLVVDPQDEKMLFTGIDGREVYIHLASLPQVPADEPCPVYETTLLVIGRRTNAN